LFAALLVVPAILFSAYLIQRADVQQRESAEGRVVQIASELANDVSTEIERGIVILKVLALSAELERGDLAAFHEQAKRALWPLDNAILLVSEEGHQLVNTAVPFGTPLPDYADPKALKLVQERREPYLTDLFHSETQGMRVINLLVPITGSSATNARNVLVLSYSSLDIQNLVAAQQTRGNSSTMITDRRGVVIARSGDKPSVGQVLPPEPQKPPKDGVAHRVTNLDGRKVVRAAAYTRRGGWTASAEVDEQQLEVMVHSSVRRLALVGLALVLLTGSLIFAYGRRIAGSIKALTPAAEGGQLPETSSVREANEVSQLLARITGDLRQSRQSLEAALDVAGVAAWGWDISRGEEVWSARTKAIFGLKPEATVTKEVFEELLHPAERTRCASEWAAALDPKGNRTHRLEYRILRANDGAERWISSKASVEFIGSTPVRVVGAMRDITDEKKAEEAVRRHALSQALLLDVTRTLISKEYDEPALCTKVFQIVAFALEADVCLNYRIEDSAHLTLICHHGVPPALVDVAKALPLESAFCGTAIDDLRPVLADSRCIATDPKGRFVRNFGITAYSCHPLFAKDGRVLGTFSIGSRKRTSFTREEHDFLQTVANFLALAWERIEAERGIEQREAHVRSILDNTLAFVGILARDGTLLEANAASLRAGGLSREDVVGRKFWDCGWWCKDCGEISRLKDAVEQVGRGGIARYDAVICTSGDGRMTIDFMLSPVRDEHGHVTYLVPSGFDITQRKQGELQIHLLMREVNHRAKNLLAVVQSIARHTARESDPAVFLDRLTDRIGGLSASQDLLVESGWHGVGLHDLVGTQLAHFRDLVGTRVILDGPPLRINAAAAQAIGMALHELATNSGKYGALSIDGGSVTIAWQIDADNEPPLFTIEWRESGGPMVSPPPHRGFGYTVTVRMAEHALSGKVTLEYPEQGVLWRLVSPVTRTLELGA
jgi:PAS domain S-box-containing protein